MADQQKLDEIEAKIVAICAAHLKKESGLTPDASLIRDLGLDSLQAIELISEIETGFGIIIPSEMLPEIDTLRDLARVVNEAQIKKSNSKPPVDGH